MKLITGNNEIDLSKVSHVTGVFCGYSQGAASFTIHLSCKEGDEKKVIENLPKWVHNQMKITESSEHVFLKPATNDDFRNTNFVLPDLAKRNALVKMCYPVDGPAKEAAIIGFDLALEEIKNSIKTKTIEDCKSCNKNKRIIAITILAPIRKEVYVGEGKFVDNKKDAIVYENVTAAYKAMSKILNTPETYCSDFYLIDAEL